MDKWQPIDALAIMERTGYVLLYFAESDRIRIGAYAPYADASYPFVWQNEHGEPLSRPWKGDEEPIRYMLLPDPPKVIR